MKKYKKVVQLDNRPIRFFDDAEQIWFWFCFCESCPKGRIEKKSDTVRPCETSDIAIIIKRLIQEKRISQEQLKILSFYGLKQIIPYEKCGDPIRHCILWKQAFLELSKAFSLKGLIVNNTSCMVI